MAYGHGGCRGANHLVQGELTQQVGCSIALVQKEVTAPGIAEICVRLDGLPPASAPEALSLQQALDEAEAWD